MSAEEVLLKFLGKPGYKPMRLEAIVQALGGTREDLRRLSKTIPRLIKAGAVVTVKGHLLALPFGGGAGSGARKPEAELLEGTILFRPSGSARSSSPRFSASSPALSSGRPVAATTV